jgi:hypothetical protein
VIHHTSEAVLAASHSFKRLSPSEARRIIGSDCPASETELEAILDILRIAADEGLTLFKSNPDMFTPEEEHEPPEPW